jgi:hypothetical protein
VRFRADSACIESLGDAVIYRDAERKRNFLGRIAEDLGVVESRLFYQLETQSTDGERSRRVDFDPLELWWARTFPSAERTLP